MSRSSVSEIEIPVLGMDTDTVPRLIPKAKAPLLKNFLMDRPGILPMRGPFCEATTWDAGGSIGLYGIWYFNDNLLLSRLAASGTATRDYWVNHYRHATGSSQLRAGNTQMKHIDLLTGTVTNVTATDADNVIGLKSVRVGNYVYGIAGDSTATSPGVGSEIYKLNHMLRWDGTTTEPLDYSINAPSGLQDIAYHYNRLILLGSISGGGNKMYWSDPLPTDGTALPTNITAWQDDVSGLTNQLIVGAADNNDFGVALAHVGQNLCIFKRHSIWMLNGTGPSTWQIKQADNEIGCIDQRSVVEFNSGVYFMSERGFMFFDGVEVRNASVGLSSSLVANARLRVGPQGADGGYVRASVIGPGYILVTTGLIEGTGISTAADTDAWLLYAPTGAWQQLSSEALTAIVAGGRTSNNAYVLTDSKLVRANYLFNLAGAPSNTRGFDSINSGTNKFRIPSRWLTRTLELAAPTEESQLHRVVMDYYWNLSSGSVNGWGVTATTRGDTGVVDTTAVLGTPSVIAAGLPTRGSFDVFNETDEVYLDIDALSAAPATFDKAELHRVIIESVPTRPSRSSL